MCAVRCCPTFSGLWEPHFCGAPVRRNILTRLNDPPLRLLYRPRQFFENDDIMTMATMTTTMINARSLMLRIAYSREQGDPVSTIGKIVLVQYGMSKLSNREIATLKDVFNAVIIALSTLVQSKQFGDCRRNRRQCRQCGRAIQNCRPRVRKAICKNSARTRSI